MNRVFLPNVRVAHNLAGNTLCGLLELKCSVIPLLLWAPYLHSTPLAPFLLSTLHILQSCYNKRAMARVWGEMWWNVGRILAPPKFLARAMESLPSLPLPQPWVSLTLYFWFIERVEHLNTSCCPAWLRTANLGRPITLRFREFKKASSVFVSMETRLGVVHLLHVTGNLKQSLGRTSQGDTLSLWEHLPVPLHHQFTKEGGHHIFLDNYTEPAEWLIHPFKAITCIPRVTSVPAQDQSSRQARSSAQGSSAQCTPPKAHPDVLQKEHRALS